MAKADWSDLSPTIRRVIVVAGAIEGILKIAALVDLKQRHADEIRGSKKAWAAAIVLINSAGAVPLAYFFRGRRTPRGFSRLVPRG